MQRLIDNLLSYSKINEDKEPFKEVDLGHVLLDVRKNLKSLIETSGAHITHGKLPHVWGDEVQLTVLFQNLISNSIKFRTDAVPAIHIEAEEKTDKWLFKVTDNGIGFPPDKAKKIFEPFMRLHARSSYEGTGLGLAICKRVVDRHGGKISATSELGKGTTFCFTLSKHP
jgi:light-regulated signal transduction histidine kinase (bacteriophytochrome)